MSIERSAAQRDRARLENRLDDLIDELTEEHRAILIDVLHVVTGTPKLSDAEYDLEEERHFIAGFPEHEKDFAKRLIAAAG
jgi:hypothetical protein